MLCRKTPHIARVHSCCWVLAGLGDLCLLCFFARSSGLGGEQALEGPDHQPSCLLRTPSAGLVLFTPAQHITDCWGWLV